MRYEDRGQRLEKGGYAIAVASLAIARPRHAARKPSGNAGQRRPEAPADPGDHREQAENTDQVATVRPAQNHDEAITPIAGKPAQEATHATTRDLPSRREAHSTTPMPVRPLVATGTPPAQSISIDILVS